MKRTVQNFLYLLPYFLYIPNKSFIFVMHFQFIGVMKLAESVFYFLYGVKAYYLSSMKLAV